MFQVGNGHYFSAYTDVDLGYTKTKTMSQSTSITGVTGTTTSAKIQVTHPAKVAREEFSGIKWLDNIMGDYEFNRYGIYAIALLLVGCLSGVAVGLGAMTSPIQIVLLTIPTMTALVMIISVAPMRLLLWTCLIACAVDVMMIIYHIVI